MEKSRKSALNKAWKKTKFNRQTYDRVISWIKKNLKEYSKYPPIYTKKEKKNLLPYNFKKTLVSSANGYLSSLDPHCAVLSAKRWDRQIQETKDSSFEGIGALLRGGSSSETMIENPLEGHPAVKAGLRAGDIITKVETVIDKRLNELTPQLVKEMVQQIIRQHLGWLVVWGGVFGGLIGLISSFII